MPKQFTLVLTAMAALAFTPASTSRAEPFTCAATDPSSEGSRPRVGLVLGGGGARGAAHIGVIRELERMQIPIHAIAGTSMGAIVGGLYASGATPAELEDIVVGMNWADALSDRPNRDDLSFRRKQDDARYPINFAVGIKDGGLRLPKGVILGQTLDLILRELTLDVSRIDDFDALPIPFRAVASDIETGEMHVMGDGDLATAIRASMSVPAVFAPVERDGRLLVDGGLVGNLPVDVVRAMGADIVIAVDVEFPLYAAEDLDSVFAVSEQMLTVLIRRETERQIAELCDYDVLLNPELGMFSSAGFGAAIETFEPGAEAAREQAGSLSRLAVDSAAWERYLASRQFKDTLPGELAFVRVEHDSRVAPELLQRRMKIAVGDPVDAARLAYEANHLYGLQVFEKVGYRLVDEDGRTGVVFDARSKSWGNAFLRFGLEIEDDFEGSTAFNLNTQLWWPQINELGAEWRTNLRLGTDPEIITEFYQPLRSDARLFVSPSLQLGQYNLKVFDVDDSIARLRISEARLGLDVGAELGTWGELRAGLFRGAGNARVKVGDPAIPNFDFNTGGALVALRTDTLDSARFPQSGTRATVIWGLSRKQLGASEDYDIVSADLSTAWTFSRNTFLVGVNVGTTYDSNTAVQDFFALGGFLRLSGLERNQLAGPHSALATLVYYRQLTGSSTTLLSFPVYVGASVEHGNVWATRSDVSFASALTNGSLFLGLDSPIGPVVLAAGFSDTSRTNFYLFIGDPVRQTALFGPAPALAR